MLVVVGVVFVVLVVRFVLVVVVANANVIVDSGLPGRFDDASFDVIALRHFIGRSRCSRVAATYYNQRASTRNASDARRQSIERSGFHFGITHTKKKNKNMITLPQPQDCCAYIDGVDDVVRKSGKTCFEDNMLH
jgi:hypothetical protein